MNLSLLRAAAAAAAGLVASTALATDVTYFGTTGSLAASAMFAASGNNLIVTLTNTSAADVLIPADILTAVFFDVTGGPLSLTRTSAVLGPTSFVLFGGTDPGGVVGGEWAYLGGLSGAPGAGAYGISSSGLNIFSGGDRFPGNDLQPPTGPDGLQYGITSAGDDPSTGNSAVTGDNAMIKNQVVFTLGGLPAGFDPAARITNVTFQYGTATDEPSFHGNTPAPGTAAAVVAMGGLAGLRRRRR